MPEITFAHEGSNLHQPERHRSPIRSFSLSDLSTRWIQYLGKFPFLGQDHGVPAALGKTERALGESSDSK
jgi:hypothetical protein